MNICKVLAVYISLLFPVLLHAQDSTRTKRVLKIFNPHAFTFSVFSNASALPVNPRQIFAHMHPGFTIGASFRYNTSPKHQWGQTVKTGFFYHRYVQGAIQLYSEVAYRYELKNGLGFDLMGGAGYVHSIPDTEILELNSDGEYVRKPNYGKPEFMGSIAAGAGYTFNGSSHKRPAHPVRVFTYYQFWLQTPFINQYVPVLPSTALHVGISYQIKSEVKRPKKYKFIGTPDF